MPPYQTQKVRLQKKYSEAAEEWDCLEEGLLTRSRSASVCMTCQHFCYTCDRYCRTLLICQVNQSLIPHGQHLNSRCSLWVKHLERELEWHADVA